eukprot:GILK01004569.1.p1 GENE.GILK01004569.1~~GILK01004569.1.p1  ORF type:complete len:820 (-),score=138.43 GILK01004569.1:154-2613(-)
MSTVEWSELHDRFYRKRDVYTMAWGNIDLNKYVIAGAPFGGPVALVRDEKKLLLLGSQSSKPRMFIYTSSGKLLASFAWEYRGLVTMGWNEDENLVCLLEDGQVLTFNVDGEPVPNSCFSIHLDRDDRIAEGHVGATGVVALTKQNQLFAVSDYKEPRPQRLHDSHMLEAPTAMLVLDKAFTRSGNVEVALATPSGSILVVDNDSTSDQSFEGGPFTKLAVSPSGKILACFNDQGVLYVTSVDFSKVFSRSNTKLKKKPIQMVWCGEDAVVLYWEKVLVIVGPFDKWITYSYDTPLCLVPECDGLRVITDTKCEFLERVPNSTEDIFKLGSCTPGAMLFDAMEAFESGNPRADENIRAIKSELPEAVRTCIDAASHEFDPTLQQNLLKAASYGKSYCEQFEPNAFVKMCQNLRVLNAIRDPEVGIPLTFSQFLLLKQSKVIDRLIKRKHHFLAFRICEFLSLKPHRVLLHWACAKVKMSDARDEELRDIILKKLSKTPGISFAEIATTAYKAGKPKLATMLLEHEPKGSDQVPLLLSMQEDELALRKAIDSGDTDLIYLAMMYIKSNKTEEELFQLIANKPLARDLLVQYCKHRDWDLLKALYYAEQRTQEAANLTVLEAYKSKHLTGRLKRLRMASEFFNQGREFAFQAQQTEDEIKLLEAQQELETVTGQNIFIDTSLSETLHNCFLTHQSKRATKLKSDFKVPDKRFWYLKVRALAELGDWEALEQFAKEKKSPIGYQPFIEACLSRKNVSEASKYIPRLDKPEQRMDAYEQIGYWREAAEASFQTKNMEVVAKLKERCPERPVQMYIEQRLLQGR